MLEKDPNFQKELLVKKNSSADLADSDAHLSDFETEMLFSELEVFANMEVYHYLIDNYLADKPYYSEKLADINRNIRMSQVVTLLRDLLNRDGDSNPLRNLGK